MPRKSIETPKFKEREPRTIVRDYKLINYESLNDFKKKITHLKALQGWNISKGDTEVILTLNSDQYDVVLPYLTIIIDDGLGFTIQIFNWFLPEDHFIYKNNQRNMRNISISNLINTCLQYKLCEGVQHKIISSSLITNAIPKSREAFKYNDNDDGDNVLVPKPLIPYDNVTFVRSKRCDVLISLQPQACETDQLLIQCDNCIDQDIIANRNEKVTAKRHDQPAKPKAPVSATSSHRIKLTLQQQRLKCNQLEQELQKIKEMLQMSNLQVDKTLNNDFINILNANQKNVTPFMKLFWEQQQKLFRSDDRGARYHPMIIRYCLSLYAKSASCYEEIRNSGILKLPSSRTLRDYKNVIKPAVGFQEGIIEDLKKFTSKYSGVQRYITIMFDKMKIKSSLVFDKNGDELIGFVDLGDPDLNFSSFGQDENNLATHAMIFYLRGLATTLKYSFSYFATKGVKSSQIMQLFWEAVYFLEIHCNLWVIAATADGASSNRSFFQLHHLLDLDNDKSICYKTINLFATWRFIYFFADAPHLLKTARNCLRHSCFGEKGRCMWNCGCYLLWSHIIQIYKEDMQSGLKILPRITDQHVFLNSYSVMTVKYAVQVLSNSMSVALTEFGPKDASETAKYCSYLDSFFDCLNVRSMDEHIKKRKPFLKPYTSLNDERFEWLTNIFLKYFQDWKDNIDNREGQYDKKDKSNMFISKQTYEGIQITTYSVVDVVKFLLQQGFNCVLTERFCQDPAEEYFSAQRQHGRRCENPDLYEFGYNANSIRIQKEVSHSSGNARGKYDSKRSWESITNDPLPKRKSK